MVKVSSSIKEAFTNKRLIPMATVNEQGVPNVIYVGLWWWEDNETLCLVNSYLRKTLENIQSNGWVSFVCFGKNGSFQIKCRAENIVEGSLFQKGLELADFGRAKSYPCRSVVVCRVVEVYQGEGGKGAGDRLA